jgi:hypothetical protein
VKHLLQVLKGSASADSGQPEVVVFTGARDVANEYDGYADYSVLLKNGSASWQGQTCTALELQWLGKHQGTLVFEDGLSWPKHDRLPFGPADCDLITRIYVVQNPDNLPRRIAMNADTYFVFADSLPPRFRTLDGVKDAKGTTLAACRGALQGPHEAVVFENDLGAPGPHRTLLCQEFMVWAGFDPVVRPASPPRKTVALAADGSQPPPFLFPTPKDDVEKQSSWSSSWLWLPVKVILATALCKVVCVSGLLGTCA